MNFAPKPSAADRLSDARRQLRQVEQQIETAAEHRRQVLRDGPADGAPAVRADRALANLKLLRARLLDQIEFLPELVMREESEAAWPPTAALARKKLEEMKQRLVRLRSKKPLDLSATDQAEIDALVPGCVAMAKHVSFLEIFEANSGRAVA